MRFPPWSATRRASRRDLGLPLALLALLAGAGPATAAFTPQYVLQWGQQGAANGDFQGPSGVAIDPGTGNVYVTDTGNHRVQVFDGTGTFLFAWGSFGTDSSEFDRPYGIAIDRGAVFVVDANNQRVQRFTMAGNYVLEWGTPGAGTGQFLAPRGIAVDGFGDVYVADSLRHDVQKFDAIGAFQLSWGSGPGAAPGQFDGPVGIGAIYTGAGGDLFVADANNHRLQRFTSTGTFVSQFGGPGAGNGQFQFPHGVAIPITGVGGGTNWDVYVTDRSNDRGQIFTGAGVYDTQWGMAGTSNGEFAEPRGIAIDNVWIYVADTDNHRVQKFGPTVDDSCPECESPPDACCAGLPQVGGPWTNILVGTRRASASWPYAVTIFDLTTPPPPEDTNWASMTRYNGPGNTWVEDSLGTVFGVTLDASGNIFVTHSSAYAGDAVGKGGPGAVYRLDSVTGAISTFVTLPNLADPAVPPGDDYPGLGNITYDCDHDQFFVTNLEDGKIYRIAAVAPNAPTGIVLDTFDPLQPDDGTPGWTPLGERLWGVQWHGDRLYYAVWAMDNSATADVNEIRSVEIGPGGALLPATDRHELWLPMLSWNNSFAASYPVADISFSASGRMLLGERGIGAETTPSPHQARVLEYVCDAGCWVPGNTYDIGGLAPYMNSEGGVDYDRRPFGGGAQGRVWASSDAIHLGAPYPDVVYGYQGLRPNLPSGSVTTSLLVDSDGFVVNSSDKMFLGDVEAPGCPFTEIGTICGRKYEDLNRNGVRDAGEPGLPGWTIQASGPGGTLTTVTGANGTYCFTNVLMGTWTITELGQPGWVQTGPAGGAHVVNLLGGQTVNQRDFGNATCATGLACVAPPTGMVAWWPFDEAPGSPTAADVAHPSPPRNVAQVFGGAIANATKVKRGLCTSAPGQFAVVPASSQLGLAFGSGSFGIDLWLNPAPAANGPRMIAEKRTLISWTPYRTQGWALYLFGMQSFLEIGNGITTQIVPGPTLAASQWSHLTVSVDRAGSTGQGRWYLNGAPVGFDFVPIGGVVSSTADLWIGQVSGSFAGATPGFQGCLDELEIFAAPISAATAAALHAAGAGGKCPEFLVVAPVTNLCAGQTTVQVCFSICNRQPTAQTFQWSLAPLPAGAGCSVAGPTSFTPSAGSVTVAPGACAPVCVTIPRPAGLTAHNATACYTISFVNAVTGECRTTTAKLRAENCWCPPASAATPPIVDVLAKPVPPGTTIGVPVGNPCGTPIAVPYSISAVWTSPDHPDPHAVRLNGLPPGEPVIGTLALAPGETGEIPVEVHFPAHDPAAVYEVVLEADVDADGDLERSTGAFVRSAYDTVETVSVPREGDGLAPLRLAATPNPFAATASIGFTLPRDGHVELAVHDVLGARIRTLHRGALAAGPHTLAWNGRDDRGRRAPAGVYFVRLDAAGRSVDAKLVKLR